MTAFETMKEALQWLRTQFPQAFLQNPAPLQIGVYEAIIEKSLADMPETPWLKHALRYYVHSPRYLQQMKVGRERIDLNGQPAGVVRDNDEAHAKERLALYKVRREEKNRQARQTVKEELSDKTKLTEVPVFGKKLTLKKAHSTPL